jgi:hypothetical protein
MNEELIELATLVYQMREAQKEYYRLRYSQHSDKRGEAGERMADLQRTVDSELRDILGLED